MEKFTSIVKIVFNIILIICGIILMFGGVYENDWMSIFFGLYVLIDNQDDLKKELNNLSEEVKTNER